MNKDNFKSEKTLLNHLINEKLYFFSRNNFFKTFSYLLIDLDLTQDSQDQNPSDSPAHYRDRGWTCVLSFSIV